MSKQMVISVVSKDRPGIVADVTGGIYSLGGDLADLNQSILCGYLTMILIAKFQTDITPEDVEKKLSEIESEVPIESIVKLVEGEIAQDIECQSDKIYMLTAQGKNRSGLVASLGEFCFERSINILDINTTLRNGSYTMILQLDLANAKSVDAVHDDLKALEEETELKIVMQHEDIFIITSEVSSL